MAGRNLYKQEHAKTLLARRIWE